MPNHELIAWSDSFLTGVEEIDRQHKILVNTLNEVGTKLGETPNSRLFEQITRDLLAYALYHFETEEDLMGRYGYVGAGSEEAASHVKQHRGFSAHVVAMRDRVHHGQSVAPDELVAFLKDWLINHICTSDQRLGRFIRALREQDAAPPP